MLTTFRRGAFATPVDRRWSLDWRPNSSIDRVRVLHFPRSLSNRNRIFTNEESTVELNKKCFASQYTEVPLVFEMSKPVLSPLYSGVLEITVSIICAYITVSLLQYATKKANEDSWSTELAPDTRIKRNRTVAGAALKAITSPVSFILPIAAILHSLRVLTCRIEQSLQLCTTCAKGRLERNAEFILDIMLRVLAPLDDVVGLVLKQGFLLAAVWFLITFKNQFVSWLLEQKSKRDPSLLQDIRRIVIPLNTLSTWVIVAFGVVGAAAFAGVDVRPLVTFGGVSGIVIGLASQSVLANTIAGINLFLSRPFLPGDRVQVFSNNGSLIYSGIVERVNPLRTIIRTDKNYPLTIPNKLLSEMVIGNESRFPTSSVAAFESGRRVGVSLTCNLEHFDKLDETRENIHTLLEGFPGLNHGMPFGVSVGTLTDENITLDIYATALKRESANFGELRVRLMRALKDTLSNQGIHGYKLSF